jgi:hypothetical protein
MSPNFLIVGYYTVNTNYQNLAHRLIKTLNSLSLPHYIKPIQDQGSWEKNTHYKANFLKECITQKKEDLLYVDVDAVFRSYPTLINELSNNYDIAYRTEDFKWRKDEALSGTIFIKNNDIMREFIDKWIEMNNNNPAERMKPETWEQKNMQKTHRNMGECIRYFNLPPEYTFIFDHSRKMFPGLKPVIEHFQESRNIHKKTNQNRSFRVRR